MAPTLPPYGGWTINRRNPLWTNLIGAILPAGGGRPQLVRGPASVKFPTGWTVNGSGWTDVVAKGGPATRWQTTGTMPITSGNVDVFGGHNAFSFVGRIGFDGTGAANYGNYFRKDGQFTGCMGIGAATAVQAAWWMPTLISGAYPGSFVTGDVVDLGFSRVTNGDITMWSVANEGGTVNSQVRSTGGGAIPVSTSGALALGAREDGAERAGGETYFAYYFDRAITLEEFNSLRRDPYRLFTPYAVVPQATAGSLIPLAFLRTDADDSVGEWINQTGSASNLWDTLNEVSPSDTDYILSPFKADGYSTASIKFRLSNPVAGRILADPVKIRYRFKKTDSGTKSLVVVLLQGTTTIASWTHTGAGLTETFQTVTQTLTTPQLSAITDFDNLFIRFDDVEV